MVQEIKDVLGPLIQLNDGGAVIRSFDSINEAILYLGVSRQYLHKILRGIKKNKYNIHYA